MLTSQISFLDLASSAPYPALSIRAKKDGVIGQQFVFDRNEETLGADVAEGGQSNGVMDASFRADGVEVTHGRRFDACRKIT